MEKVVFSIGERYIVYSVLCPDFKILGITDFGIGMRNYNLGTE
jgi:hypothetical protein